MDMARTRRAGVCVIYAMNQRTRALLLGEANFEVTMVPIL